ncbi:hypothetical protein [Streptomyces griseofuscus]|uniref:hypothetical protein n=1 Tax=Streptomyces griseofuscus TaxID=146922 RepID=UPI003810F408
MSQPTQASTTSADVLVGTWAEELFLTDGTYTSTIRFVENGRVLLLRGPRPGCVGAGNWRATGGDGFWCQMAELVLDGDGVLTGWVDIEQNLVVSGDTLTGTGVAHVYDADDTLVARSGIEVRAVRR